MNMKTKILLILFGIGFFLNDSYAKGIMGALFVYPGQTQATLTLIESREEGPLLDFFESLDLPELKPSSETVVIKDFKLSNSQNSPLMLSCQKDLVSSIPSTLCNLDILLNHQSSSEIQTKIIETGSSQEVILTASGRTKELLKRIFKKTTLLEAVKTSQKIQLQILYPSVEEEYFKVVFLKS